MKTEEILPAPPSPVPTFMQSLLALRPVFLAITMALGGVAAGGGASTYAAGSEVKDLEARVMQLSLDVAVLSTEVKNLIKQCRP